MCLEPLPRIAFYGHTNSCLLVGRIVIVGHACFTICHTTLLIVDCTCSVLPSEHGHKIILIDAHA